MGAPNWPHDQQRAGEEVGADCHVLELELPHEQLCCRVRTRVEAASEHTVQSKE